jgi:hypothetical protein
MPQVRAIAPSYTAGTMLGYVYARHQKIGCSGAWCLKRAMGLMSISMAVPRKEGDRYFDTLSLDHTTLAPSETMVKRPPRPHTTSRMFFSPKPPLRFSREVSWGVVTAASMTVASLLLCRPRIFLRRSAAGIPMPRSTTARRTDVAGQDLSGLPSIVSLAQRLRSIRLQGVQTCLWSKRRRSPLPLQPRPHCNTSQPDSCHSTWLVQVEKSVES